MLSKLTGELVRCVQKGLTYVKLFSLKYLKMLKNSLTVPVIFSILLTSRRNGETPACNNEPALLMSGYYQDKGRGLPI
jgi:hypothetical protein